MLPERLSQILITKPGSKPTQTQVMKTNIQSLKDLYPAASHHLYEDEEIQQLLLDNFPPEVFKAYDALIPYSFKADLAGFCIVYLYGGLYSDLSHLHIQPVDLDEEHDAIVFRDVAYHPSWAVSCALFVARPKANLFQKAIERIVEYHGRKFVGLSPLDPTGPYMFGKTLANYDAWNRIVFGDSRMINTDYLGRHNIAKFMPGDVLIALRNKGINGNLQELIGKSGNDYNELWHKGKVWR